MGLRRLGRRPTHPPACSNSLSRLYRGQGQGKEETYCREPRQRDCLTREQKATDTRFLLDFSLPLLLRSAEELVLPRPPAGSDRPSGSCWRKVCRGELCKYSRLKAGEVTADLYLMQMFPMFCSIVLLINKNQPKTKKALGVVCVTWTEPLACTCLRNGDATCHGGCTALCVLPQLHTLLRNWGGGDHRRPRPRLWVTPWLILTVLLTVGPALGWSARPSVRQFRLKFGETVFSKLFIEHILLSR